MSRAQLAFGKRRGTPRTGRQSITGPTYRDRQPLTLTFAPMDNQPNLHVFVLWEEAQRKPTQKGPSRLMGTYRYRTLLLRGDSASCTLCLALISKC